VKNSTNAFDYDLIENYFIRNFGDNDFWLFCSHGSEVSKPSSLNRDFDERDVLEKTIFGTKFNNEDVSFMIDFVPWVPNSLYDQYDDREVLRNKPFYVVVEPEIENGNYHIFKCISNNNKSLSTTRPDFNSSILDGIYFLSDGYIWKYMSSTPFSLFRKFAARNLIPVYRNQQVENIAAEGIFNIAVENADINGGYERITGIVENIFPNFEGTPGVMRITLRNLFSATSNTNPTNLFGIEENFIRRSLYVEKSGATIGAREYRIRNSGISATNTPFVNISTPVGFTISPNDRIEILPRVVIEGNGNDASAVCILDSETNSRIVSIRMLNYGQEYTNAVARIADPIGFDPRNSNRNDVRCIVRPILSPIGGHGSNILKELKSQYLSFSKVISSSGNPLIPSSGKYSKFSLVKNPNFSIQMTEDTFDNRIKIVLSDPIPGDMVVGDTISQNEVSGKIHEIDVSDNAIYIIDYVGPYSSTFSTNLPLRYRNTNLQINSIEESKYITRSGDVLITTDITPIQRENTRSEQVKIILDF
jgi:hypothetical protein